MLIKGRVLITIVIAATLVAVVMTTNSLKGSAPKDTQGLGFPFNLMIERKFDAIGAPMCMATIILPERYFSKENLDRLFRWYSEQHPNRAERLTVQVYTDPKKIPPSKMMTLPSSETPEKESPGSSADWADAAFFRTRPSAVSHGAGENEFFIFDPMMSGNTDQRRIVVKGMDQYAAKRIIDVWEPESKDRHLRISAYESGSVEPPRVYYVLESRELGSEYWESIMAFQQDGETRIPSDQVRFLSNKIVYAFMGPLFAVSFDGAVEWAVWDAERDVPCQERWTAAKIRGVQIEQSGLGMMTVWLAGESRTLELRSSDFGAHWACN